MSTTILGREAGALSAQRIAEDYLATFHKLVAAIDLDAVTRVA